MRNKLFIKNSFKSFFSFVILASLLSGAFSVAAQTRKTVSRTPKTSVSKVVDKKDSKCNGGWSGTISYSKTLDERDNSESPGIRKNKDRIIQEWSHNVSYIGRMTVDGSSNPRTPDAFGKIEFSDVRMQHGIEKVWDSCHAFNDEHWFVIDGKRDETETGNGEGAAQSFNLQVNEFNGTYAFSFKFPDGKGKYILEDHTKRTGHCQPKNNEPIDLSQSRETTIGGEVGVIENQKIDPKNPNVLAGSIMIDENDYNNPKRVKTPITVISWKFKRCSPPLMIADVKFSQPLYPSPSSWVEIGKNDHAIDGNQVKITATVINLSGEQKTANVQFKELKENAILPNSGKSETFAPHEEKEVELIWDTSGYAWKEANIWSQPEINREIEVRIPDDAMTKNIEVDPKPVVVIPGLWSKKDALAKLFGFFKNLPTTQWRATVAPVYINKFAVENMQIVEKTVKDIQKQENAWHVDLVAHSTGGLIGRSYVHALMPTQFDGKPTATHLVMIGTPNMGTPCASGVDDIFTKILKRPADSLSELTIKNMKVFNQNVTNRNGTKFAVLVGNAYAPICQMDAPGDGITPNVSAIWNIKTWKFSTVRAPHEEMPGEQANFQQIVNWLAVPPKGDHAPDNSTASNGNFLNNDNVALNDSRSNGVMFLTANFNRNETAKFDNAIIEDDPAPNFSTGVTLAANEAKEIEIPVTNGSHLSLILYTSPNVSATLIDETGAIVAKNLSGTPEADEIFRTMTVKKAFQTGKWKLKLESRDPSETEAAITVFIDYNAKFNSGNPNKIAD